MDVNIEIVVTANVVVAIFFCLLLSACPMVSPYVHSSVCLTVNLTFVPCSSVCLVFMEVIYILSLVTGYQISWYTYIYGKQYIGPIFITSIILLDLNPFLRKNHHHRIKNELLFILTVWCDCLVISVECFYQLLCCLVTELQIQTTEGNKEYAVLCTHSLVWWWVIFVWSVHCGNINSQCSILSEVQVSLFPCYSAAKALPHSMPGA